MEIAAMEVVVDGNVKALEQAMKQGEQSFKGLAGAANSSSNQVSQSLAKVAAASAKTDSALATGGKAAKKTGTDFTALSRVIQDFPFGFIGIQNNITQLLPAAGALGLALSAITAAVTFSQVGFSAWTRGLNNNKKSVDDVAKANEELKKSYDGIISNLSEESVKVQTIIQQIQDEVLSRKQRNAAIEELKRISPEFFANLDKENATIQSITTAYDKYAKSIVRAIEAKVLEKQITTITEQILGLEQRQNGALKSKMVLNGKLVTVENARYSNEISKETEYQKFRSGRAKLTAKESDELGNLKIAQQALIEQLAAIKPIDFNIKEDKVTKVKTFRDILAEFRKEVAGIQTQFSQGLITAPERDEDIVKKLVDTIGKLGEIKAPVKVISDLSFEFLQTQLNVARAEFVKKVIKEVPPPEIPLEVNISPKFDQSDDEKNRIKKFFDTLKDVKKGYDLGIPIPLNIFVDEKAQAKLVEQIQAAIKVNDTLKQAVAGTFEQIGSSIGDVFSGGNFGESLGKGFFKLIGGFLTDVGKQLIAIALIGKTIKVALKSIFTNPILALGAGVAAIALGSVISNLANQKPKGFATGGYVSGPGSKTSDSIPARLSKGEFVMKAAAVDKFGVGFLNSINNLQAPVLPNSVTATPNVGSISAGQTFIIPDVVLRGPDLYLSFKRTEAQIGRTS